MIPRHHRKQQTYDIYVPSQLDAWRDRLISIFLDRDRSNKRLQNGLHDYGSNNGEEKNSCKDASETSQGRSFATRLF